MIRRKVAERFHARRRAAAGGNTSGEQVSSSLPSPSTPDAVFSATKPSAGTERTNSIEGFLFVDDRDAHSDSADDLEDHEALRQAVADDISGFEVSGALDGDELFDSELEKEEPGSVEDPPPRPKPSPPLSGSGGRVRTGAMSIDNEEETSVGNSEEGAVSSKSSKPALKPWQMMSDKDIYEQQLGLMQDQLTSAMIEKEELKSR